MRPHPAFERTLIVHTSPRPDRGLLNYGTMLASPNGCGEAIVAALPASELLRSLPAEAESAFAARGLRPPRLHWLAEPDLDEVIDQSQHFGSDLLVMRHPRLVNGERSLAERILAEAPCSVCFVPENPAPRIERIVAGIDLNGAGHDLLAHAARLTHWARAAELIAVHSWSSGTNWPEEQLIEKLRVERHLDLMRFIARADLHGVDCTPIVEEAEFPHRALARAAAGREADLVIIGRRPGIPPRPTAELLRDCRLPILQLLLTNHRAGRLESIVKRWFPHTEPTIN